MWEWTSTIWICSGEKHAIGNWMLEILNAKRLIHRGNQVSLCIWGKRKGNGSFTWLPPFGKLQETSCQVGFAGFVCFFRKKAGAVASISFFSFFLRLQYGETIGSTTPHKTFLPVHDFFLLMLWLKLSIHLLPLLLLLLFLCNSLVAISCEFFLHIFTANSLSVLGR